MPDPDPFSIFGDDDDDDNDATEASSSKAQILLTMANRRMLQKAQIEGQTTADNAQSIATSHVDNTIDFGSFEGVDLAWDPPLYMGPIMCVSSVQYGGGREFVATQDLEPGTLILVEGPVIEWPPEQIGERLGLISVCHILEHEEAQKILYDLEDFHPTKTAVHDFKAGDAQISGMVEKLEIEFCNELPLLVDLAKVKGLKNRNDISLDCRDMIRLLLTLRYNGFESGVYLHLAMLNHNCYPNSVKFASTSSFSEVRTTRSVKAGEALTISYLPTIMSHASRRHHLWEQHLFDIGDMVPDSFIELEIVGGRIPHSSSDCRDDSVVTSRIESTTGRLCDHFREIHPLLVANIRKENPMWGEAKALELASLELCTEAKHQLDNNRHVLLIPCLRLHLELCDIIHLGQILPLNQKVLLLVRSLASCINLIEVQTLFYGPNHFDLARSYNELSQTLAELLSTAPKQLLSAGFRGLDSVAACATVESNARKEFQRIRELYPKDAEKYVQNTCAKS